MSTVLREVLAKNIKELRLSKHLSQEELAEICGLHRTYISDIERGNRNVSIDNIEKIARSLDVDPALLLEEQNEHPV